MKRYQKHQQNQEEYNPWETPTISKSAKVGIYGRQSTINQVKHNIGAGDMQIEQLITLAKRMGAVDDADLILYIENKRADGTIKNASGRLRIDQREGLSALVERIESDEIKAVIVFLEDRLFRDETQIEANKFILICQEHNCLVITPHMTYDFRNPYHRKQFRWKCEQAADFLRDYVKARLLDKKEQFAMRGLYDGRSIPPGYIIDRRATIEGVENPSYKKFTDYQPHRERVLDIFKQFALAGGKAKKLYTELKKIPVLFPDFDPGVDPRTVSRLALTKVPGGYHISFNGLQQLLTNVTYIGWWTYKGRIIKNNHPAIVPEDLFWYAFNRLSDVTPEGEERERERYRPRYQRQHKPEAPALLKEIIQTNDTRKSVYVGQRFTDWYYLVMWKDTHKADVPELYSVLIEHVDEAFKTALLKHMHNTEDFEAFRTLASTMRKEAEEKRGNTTTELARIERRMQATLASLTTDTDLPTVTRTALNQIYAELYQQREVLVNPPQKEAQEQLTDLLSYHDLLERLSHEEALARVLEDMQLLAQATTKRVMLDGMSPHFLLLTTSWRTPLWGTDTALLWRPKGRAPFWTDGEIELLGEHYPTMPQSELMQLLPRRSWQSIVEKAHKLGVTRKGSFERSTGDTTLSWEDIQVMQHYGISLEELSSDNQIIWLGHPAPPMACVSVPRCALACPSASLASSG